MPATCLTLLVSFDLIISVQENRSKSRELKQIQCRKEVQNGRTYLSSAFFIKLPLSFKSASFQFGAVHFYAQT
jgi:hypothetical protein